MVLKECQYGVSRVLGDFPCGFGMYCVSMRLVFCSSSVTIGACFPLVSV
jgi:hypothetical protein